MERTLVQFVWKHAWRDQVLIVLASLASFPLILAALYIPKLIVNRALRGTEFPQEFLGLSLEQLEYLFALCGSLLALIFLNNAVKYYINVSKGLTGERILRRIRFTIFDRVTRLSLPRLRRTSPGEVVQIVAAEVEPLGGFSGELVATPVYQGGQLLLYIGFIIAQDPFLGLAAIILFPTQAFIVPRVQRLVIRLVQSRIRNTREMTSEITETIQGIEEMRLAQAHACHLARMSERLYTNFRIRYRIFFLKYAIKFFNNVINNITPFFFYAFGGYLVIQGRLDLGALVAILAAYKDIAPPWRELLTYYQNFSDMSARYEAVYEAYGRERLVEPGEPVSLAGETIILDRVSSESPPETGGIREVSLVLPPGGTVVLLGEEEGGRSVLLRTLAGLERPAAGTITAGMAVGTDVLERAHRDIAYVGRSPHILWGTVRENVAYGLIGEAGLGEPPDDWERRQREARLTGAPPQSPFMDWVDYRRAGLADAAEFDARAIDILKLVGLERELFARGLGTVLDPARAPELAAAALAARAMVAEEAEDLGYETMVEAWDAESYLENATLAENLFFGVPDRPVGAATFAAQKEVLDALRASRLEREVAEIGLEAAETLQELLSSLGKDTSLLDQIGLIQHSERDEYTRIATIARRRGVMRIGRGDRVRLIQLAFQLVPMRHRLGVLDAPERRARLVAARPAIRRAFEPATPFTYLDAEGNVPGLPIIENILRGRPRIDRRDASPPIETRLEKMMSAHGMHDFVLAAGLNTEVGFSGSSLAPAQRRRLALARALVSAPALVLLDGIADDAGAEDVRLRRAIRRHLPDSTIVYGTGNAALQEMAELVMLVAGGRVETTAPAPARRSRPGAAAKGKGEMLR
ncbi:MAG TPA: ABC transporter ATP-binding protein [Paracoccaceae bacterium]|nr:ABC transporter ATP-binding protein [Paracoccaceae bacterium]